MLKRLSVVLVLSAALLFGGMLPPSVDAASNNDQNHKLVYHVNGKWGHVSLDSLNKYFDLFKRIQWPFNFNDWRNDNVEQPESDQQAPEASEQPEQPAPDKPETSQPEQSAPNKPETSQPEQQAPSAPEAEVETPEENQNQGQMEELNQFEQQVVELTNNERAKAGLAPLQADWELSRVAREKSRDMATSSYFDHNSPTYGSPFDMMRAYGINYRTAGENIAKGQRTPQEVVNAWMNSPGHRENIMNGNFTHIGVGYVESGNHWTQMFIGK